MSRPPLAEEPLDDVLDRLEATARALVSDVGTLRDRIASET
ncbi:hypothetical protein [Knoellia koreensis]|nr:hypothetical protein [Knoellia sp. DB2414S]